MEQIQFLGLLLPLVVAVVVERPLPMLDSPAALVVGVLLTVLFAAVMASQGKAMLVEPPSYQPALGAVVVAVAQGLLDCLPPLRGRALILVPMEVRVLPPTSLEHAQLMLEAVVVVLKQIRLEGVALAVLAAAVLAAAVLAVLQLLAQRIRVVVLEALVVFLVVRRLKTAALAL
jgi:hypothetical protein